MGRELAAAGLILPDAGGLALHPSGQASSADIDDGYALAALDPHDDLHRFVLLPTIAGLVVLAGAAVVGAVLSRWRASGQPRGKRTWLQYGLLGFLWWLALSLFLILDLAGSVSLYLWFTAIYATGWALVGLLVLHPRPIREKLLVVALFLTALFSIRFVDWNSRKPFLKDLERVSLGTPVAQVDEIMGDYMEDTGALTQVDEQGRIISGTITFRHTTAAWGNSDYGILTIAGGRVVDVDFVPD
jgi:hypothetical protein